MDIAPQQPKEAWRHLSRTYITVNVLASHRLFGRANEKGEQLRPAEVVADLLLAG